MARLWCTVRPLGFTVAATAGIKAPTIKNDTGTPGVMIRNFPSNSNTASRTAIISRTYGYAAALGVVLALVIPATGAYGQSGYLSRDPNVTINMSVLDELGRPATVAGQYITNDIVTMPPVLFPPTAMPVSSLVGPLISRRFSSVPVLRRQVFAPPIATAAAPPAVAPPPVAVAPPPPVVLAPAKVEVRAARPAPPKAPTPVPPVPVPPPAPAVAKVAPAPEAAPQEKVAVAVPPPPAPSASPPPTPAAKPTPAPEPAAPEPAAPEPKVQEQPEPSQPAARTPPTPALTPSPTGPVPAAPVQTASRPDAITQQLSFRVLFDDKSAKISDSARAPLQELSNKMKESENLRVQLMAYAEGTAETASQARRLSLSRALAVRSFLINQGVRSTRMDVRALGNKSQGGPSNRVDAVLVER